MNPGKIRQAAIVAENSKTSGYVRCSDERRHMENPWFGPKADVGSAGIVAWQGAVALILGIGGAMFCHLYLENDLATAGCIVALIVTYLLKYDPETESH